MIQTLVSIAAHFAALALYPGLAVMLAFGGLAEIIWMRLTMGSGHWPELPLRRPSPVVVTVSLCAMLASVQLAAPLSPMPAEERSVVLAAAALAFTTWAELALTVEYVAEPGLLFVIQLCWLLAVLGPAVQPESLRPQVLGNVLVPELLPLKVASGVLYLLCLPALLRLWPVAPPGERRTKGRLDATRLLCWFPYCGLFTTLFITPSADDLVGALRFFGNTFAVGTFVIATGFLIRRRGAGVRSLYARTVPPFGVLVLLIVIGTSVLVR